MSLLNSLHSLWSSWNDASLSPNLTGPLVNIDGTPMLDSVMDILGNPFGVTDSSAHDWNAGADMGCDHWDSGAGSFGDDA